MMNAWGEVQERETNLKQERSGVSHSSPKVQRSWGRDEVGLAILEACCPAQDPSVGKGERVLVEKQGLGPIRLEYPSAGGHLCMVLVLIS